MKPMKGRKIDVAIKGGNIMAGIFGVCLLTHAGLGLAEGEIRLNHIPIYNDI